MAGFSCKALFDYKAEKEDELSFQPGDIILNVNVLEEGGWWEGSLNGKKGWFPDNFVEKIAEAAKPPPPQAQQAPASSRPAPTPAAGDKGAKKMAKVTYDYAAANPDELTLNVGQLVQITNTEEEGWWEGVLDGKKGVFPNNFVEMLPASAAPAQPAKPKPQGAMGGASTKGGGKMGFGNIFEKGGPQLKNTGAHGRAKSVFLENAAVTAPAAPADTRELYKATFDYTAEQQDELGLTIGQLIRIIKKEEGGWWEGQVEGAKDKGWFPDNFVEPASAAEIAAANGKAGGRPAGGKSPLAIKKTPPPAQTVGSKRAPPSAPGGRSFPKPSQGGGKKPPPLVKQDTKPKLPTAVVSKPQNVAPAQASSASVSKETENELRDAIKSLRSTMTTEISSLKKQVASLTSDLDKERSIRKKWVQLEQDRTKQLAALM